VTGGEPVGSAGSPSEVPSRGGCRSLSPGPSPPLVRLRSPSAHCRYRCQRVIGSALPPRPFGPRRSPFGNRRIKPVGLLPRTSRSSHLRQPPPVRDGRWSAIGVAPSSGYGRRARHVPPRSCRGARAHAVPPMGFLPLERIRFGASTQIPRACPPGYGPSPGFRTLLTASSAPSPPGLFHPGSACGVSPFRAFPSRGDVAPLGARAFLTLRRAECPATPNPTPSRARPWPERADSPGRIAEAVRRRLQGLAPLESPLPSSGGLGHSWPDALLGFLLSRGFASRAWPDA